VAGNYAVPTYVQDMFTLLDSLAIEAVILIGTSMGGLGAVPMLLLRGENSDILSPDCVARMRTRKPDMHYREIPRRGHAPTLNEPAARVAIDAFLRQPEITGETTV
jgi:pimeloyl-ACP methyl ester carboxylesterase